MSQRHVLIDASKCVARDGAAFEGQHGSSKWHARIRQCHGGRSEGVDVVEINNGAISLDVLPTRGMGIWRVRRGSKTLGWQSPVREPVHPAFVPVFDPSGLGWLEGFNELMCRCGLESNGGADFDDRGKLLYPLHGRIANLPAHHVELLVDEETKQLTLRGVVDETRFHFQSLRLTTSITTTIGSTEFAWHDEVENIGGRDASIQMLYHFNLGQPLLQAGAQLSAPIDTVAPLTHVAAREGVEHWNTIPPPRPDSAEQVFCAELLADDAGNTRVLVSQLTDDEAISVRFNKRQLPCFTLWRNTPAEIDGYVIGLEPATNFPNPRTFEKSHNRVVTLRPGEKWTTQVAVGWHTDASTIAAEQRAIEAIQATGRPNFLPTPRSEWSAKA